MLQQCKKIWAAERNEKARERKPRMGERGADGAWGRWCLGAKTQNVHTFFKNIIMIMHVAGKCMYIPFTDTVTTRLRGIFMSILMDFKKNSVNNIPVSNIFILLTMNPE